MGSALRNGSMMVGTIGLLLALTASASMALAHEDGRRLESYLASGDGTGPTCFHEGTWENKSTESGTVADICESDDIRWCARRATFTPSVGMLLYAELEADVWTTSPDSMTVSVEVSIDNPDVTNITGQLKLKNQISGQYVIIASGPISATDTVFSGSPPSNPPRYVGAHGGVDIQFIFIQTEGGPNWMGCIDQATVTVK